MAHRTTPGRPALLLAKELRHCGNGFLTRPDAQFCLLGKEAADALVKSTAFNLAAVDE
jgi:hypothetical protein